MREGKLALDDEHDPYGWVFGFGRRCGRATFVRVIREADGYEKDLPRAPLGGQRAVHNVLVDPPRIQDHAPGFTRGQVYDQCPHIVSASLSPY